MANSAIIIPPQGSTQIGTTQTASSSANIQFTSGITTSYSRYFIIIEDLVPASTSNGLQMRFSTNGGSSFDSSALYSMGYQAVTSSGAAGGTGVNQTAFLLNYNAINTSTKSYGVIEIVQPGGSQANKYIFNRHINQASAITQAALINAVYTNASAVNAFELYMTSGNIASGSFSLWGLV